MHASQDSIIFYIQHYTNNLTENGELSDNTVRGHGSRVCSTSPVLTWFRFRCCKSCVRAAEIFPSASFVVAEISSSASFVTGEISSSVSPVFVSMTRRER